MIKNSESESEKKDKSFKDLGLVDQLCEACEKINFY